MTLEGQEAMLKDRVMLFNSMGDEAATKTLGMGVVTHNIQGKCYFVAWSMDVQFEGENVVRHMDMTTHNHMGPKPGKHTAVMHFGQMTSTQRKCKGVDQKLY